MINFLYDLTAVQPSPQSKFHGGGEYGEVVFFKLLENLDKIHLAAYYNSSAYLNPDILKAIEEKSITLYDIKNISVSEIIKKENIQRAYSAMLNLNQNWPLGEIELYNTVHGLRTLEMPYDSIMLSYEKKLKEILKDILFMTVLKKWYYKKLLCINGRLVQDKRIKVSTISNHSLASINSFYPETKKLNIPVFASPTFEQLDNYKVVKNSLPDSKLAEYGIEKSKYFLITSAARWNKNALRALYAFDQLVSENSVSGYKLVITGVTDKSIFTKKLKNSDKVVLLPYIERDELELLNRNAYCFIYPSLNEGFGYPPIDSMSFGVPVIASGSSSIPEVCGNAAIYFDPYSVSEIKNRILQILTPSIYSDMVIKAKAQHKIICEKQKRDLNSLAEYLTK